MHRCTPPLLVITDHVLDYKLCNRLFKNRIFILYTISNKNLSLNLTMKFKLIFIFMIDTFVRIQFGRDFCLRRRLHRHICWDWISMFYSSIRVLVVQVQKNLQSFKYSKSKTEHDDGKR